LPVIFLTERSSKEERIQGYKVGCDVYLPKPFEMDELGAVIRNLLERSQIIKTEIIYSEQQKPAFQLTKREKQVLDLLSKGLTNVAIGEELHLSPKTIEKYVSKLFDKTKKNNRSELLRYALENHLVD
jgi:DNA-binding NarL/FixJ family response regulator